jgi:hypothetical protein
VGNASFFTGPDDTAQQFAAIKRFPFTIFFNHRDRHEFDALVGGEAMFTL